MSYFFAVMIGFALGCIYTSLIYENIKGRSEKEPGK